MPKDELDPETEEKLKTLMQEAYTLATKRFNQTLVDMLGDMPGLKIEECRFMLYADIPHHYFDMQCFGGSPEFLTDSDAMETFLKKQVAERPKVRKLMVDLLMRYMLAGKLIDEINDDFLKKKTDENDTEAARIFKGQKRETEH